MYLPQMGMGSSGIMPGGSIMIGDAQVAEAQILNFLVGQAAHVEPEVYRTRYPGIQYPLVVPVDDSANDFVEAIAHFSMDSTGRMKKIGVEATDLPTVAVHRSSHLVRVTQYGIAIHYNMFELGRAMLLGIPFNADYMTSARRFAEEETDRVVLHGDPDMGWDGLLNSSVIDAQNVAPQAGSGTALSWFAKTGYDIARDVNTAVGDVWTQSNTVEVADTVALGPVAMNLLVTTPINPENPETSIRMWLRNNNIYTQETGNPLNFITLRGLDTAGPGGVGRMLVYRRGMDVLKLHRPMMARFLTPVYKGIFTEQQMVMRLGGLEIRLPNAIRYRDTILTDTEAAARAGAFDIS